MTPDNTQGQLHSGQLLADRYVIEALIGRGGMAEVYRGRDERLARAVALKVLRGHYALDPALRTRFEEEARAAALVSHPNVVAVYDAGEDDSKAFIVMELVEGETLYDRIARGPVSPAVARSIGGQVLDALAAAHARGVLHRDIKPANVLITPEGEAKVADFGIAKAIHPSPEGSEPTSMNMVLGTPSYLAPERAQGHPATVASDVWAVGVLLYESVTGVRPFEGDNPIAITLAAQQAQYVPVLERRPEVDPGLAAVIERALDPDPERRFASAAEMAQALRDPQSDATLIMTGAGLGLAGAGLAGAGADATRAMATSPATVGTPYAIQETSHTTGERRRGRRGTAVLVGAALAALLGGLLALILLAPGSKQPTNPTNATTSTVKRSTTTTSSSTTSSPTSSSPTTTTLPPTTTTLPPTTTTLPPTTTTLPPTTTTLPPTTTTVPSTTPPTSPTPSSSAGSHSTGAATP